MATDLVWQGIIFAAGSALLIYLSWDSLGTPFVHGFYRYFAWECILALFIFNVRFWFVDPLSPFQIISWILLAISGFFVIAGMHLLRKYGELDRFREDVPLVAFEKTTRLVTEGIYGYIRHPLYGSLLSLSWAIYLKNPGRFPAIAAALAALFLILTAKADEAESRQFFGPAYEEYMEHSKMFIPFIF